MNAVVCRTFGAAPVLEAVSVPTPKPGTVRIRTLASAISAGDWLMAHGSPWVIRPVFAGMLRPGPPVLGLDVAGVIEAVGEGVEGWAVGDRVAGELSHAWAEQVVADPKRLARIPEGVSPLVAAALPVSGVAALQGIRDAAAVKPGDKVLVVGASGGVGHLAVQVACALGAAVTGVCSAGKADLVRECGAVEVIDYAVEDFTDRKGTWDAVFDLVGSQPLAACLETLRPGGRYVLGAGRVGGPLLGPLPLILGTAVRGLFDARVKGFAASPSVADLDTLLAWAADGTVAPHLGHVVPLSEAARGLRLVGEGKACGKVALQVGPISAGGASAGASPR